MGRLDEVLSSPADVPRVKLVSTPNGAIDPSALAVPGQRFVARQPILDRSQAVFGYELLFRNGIENYFHADSEAAARSTLDSFLLFGWDTLCDGRRAFVNCTRDVLLKDLFTLLPSTQAVAEILETVAPDQEVIAACQRLKKAGYLIALDDFSANDPRVPICGLADILKVDIRATTPAQRAEIVARHASGKCKLLAEKVETQQEYQECLQAGFAYFQGYFFCRLELMTAREVPASQVHYLRLMETVSRAEIDMRELERIIKQEPAICYRLLRYLNSPLFGFAREIQSIRHALAILGEREIRRWIRLVVLVGVAEQKCSELLLMALSRGRFCELLSHHIKSESDLFLMGMLSVMNAILEVPMEVVLQQIPVDQATKEVLLCHPSPLRPIYQLMLAQESAEWDASSMLAQQLHIPDDEVSQVWWQAMQWAQSVTGA